MSVPMVNLRPLLAATEPAWRANLASLFDRMQFILGEQVEAFERELAQSFGAKFAVAVGSGTAAIELGLRAAGLGGSGAEVIVPALTSPFTAQAVLAAGCRPRFADVDPERLLLDPRDAARRANRRTRAIVPVHLYGQPCAMAPLGDVAVVQDACQAHGASLQFSGTVAYSFYPTKNLPCLGDGGAVLTNSQRAASSLRLLRDGGRRNDQLARVPAIHSRLDEMQACYLRAFLPKLAEWNAERVRLASLYDAALLDCALVRPAHRAAGSVCHLYIVRTKRRDQLRKFLAERGIATGVHYPIPLHLHPAFAASALKRGDLPVAEQACREVMSLPLWPGMGSEAVEQVADAVRKFTRATQRIAPAPAGRAATPLPAK